MSTCARHIPCCFSASPSRLLPPNYDKVRQSVTSKAKQGKEWTNHRLGSNRSEPVFGPCHALLCFARNTSTHFAMALMRSIHSDRSSPPCPPPPSPLQCRRRSDVTQKFSINPPLSPHALSPSSLRTPSLAPQMRREAKYLCYASHPFLSSGICFSTMSPGRWG